LSTHFPPLFSIASTPTAGQAVSETDLLLPFSPPAHAIEASFATKLIEQRPDA
jgi:hypothetical protein